LLPECSHPVHKRPSFYDSLGSACTSFLIRDNTGKTTFSSDKLSFENPVVDRKEDSLYIQKHDDRMDSVIGTSLASLCLPRTSPETI
ncbi:MAG: hypothetical protein ACYTDV_18625, partial [Planctomycetota bacterium]